MITYVSPEEQLERNKKMRALTFANSKAEIKRKTRDTIKAVIESPSFDSQRKTELIMDIYNRKP